MKVTVNDHGTTAAFAADMRNNGDLVRQAMMEAATVTAEQTQTKCRDDIASAGNFGRWTNRLKSTAVETPDGADVVTTFEGGAWRTFQEGRVVYGRPLLWLPLSFSDAKGTRAENYPGELIRVDRRATGKAPLLISASDREPKYVGLESVTIPKKFHLIEIAQEEGEQVGARYEQSFAGLHG